MKDIRRATRRQFSAEEKIRIVLEGLRGEESIAELCRREGIASSMYYGWSKEFLEAGKKRLAGDTARAATSDEVKDLRREASALKEVVADLTLENRLLKKSMIGDGGDGGMRYPASEKPRSSAWSSSRICRSAARWRSSASREPRSTAGTISTRPAGRRRWRTAPPGPAASGTAFPRRSGARSSTLALDEPELSPRELAVRFTDEQEYFVSEASVYRLLKAHDLITSPAYIVIKAADEFHDKTTAPNQLWQTDFTYLKVTGWGWYYLSTVLDDFSRFIVAWKLCATMQAQDVTETLDLALAASGLDQVTVAHRPRLLSDNGSSYISGDLAEWLAGKGMKHIRGAPNHPQTQGKIERWHQTLKNRILLENYYLPGALEEQVRRLRGALQSRPLPREPEQSHPGRRLLRSWGGHPARDGTGSNARPSPAAACSITRKPHNLQPR